MSARDPLASRVIDVVYSHPEAEAPSWENSFSERFPTPSLAPPLFVIPVPGESGGILGVGDSVCVVLTRFGVGGLLLLPGRGAGRDVIARVGDAGARGNRPRGGDVAWAGDALQGSDIIQICRACYRITALWQGVLSDDLHHVIASQAADIA